MRYKIYIINETNIGEQQRERDREGQIEREGEG
jgi:hypothetical protein